MLKKKTKIKETRMLLASLSESRKERDKFYRFQERLGIMKQIYSGREVK
ncbi:hypothetical protein ACFLWG_03650 [Chloroflexota bacterium]